ncbi:hypothetical protein JQ612_05860 [Bradyrhizobium manausense]|uniref:hypothetical protein n=1 Tax=Bradyrhizobium manausense TaxID=989370 RepID=UPI001BA6985A|nr:hypothetical protein [Bradyrhizobium manausense]MBR0691526.1 hypothetical protein [Bradyrhizobium manausense]MBR0726936.1 hypothetical protein [Bradyrhizobium manausense]MBR0832715.1 hypothetical protein [Bradyrhizobium manausense]
MNWAWASSLDQVWRSPAFPMWLTLAAAGFFGLILLITLLRAEKSVANGALTVITLLSIGIAVAATMRIYGPLGQETSTVEARTQATVTATLPALSCLDDIAGDAVQVGCEKALFGSPDAAATAVSYTAARIDRLTALGDVATAEKSLTPDLKVLRKSLEHDRYGLVAQVLVMRDACTQFDCAAFRSLTDQQQVAANMDAHLYDMLVARYAPTWNAPGSAPAGTPFPGAVAALPPSMPTGKPTNAEFPSASSTPPVSIMNPEPSTRQPPAANAAAAPAQRAPAATSAQATAPGAPAAKKPPAPKAARAPAAAPVPLAPPPATAPAAADND